VISNVVGAAAFNNSTKVLQQLIKKKKYIQGINFHATERQDFNQKG
jgi:hypothetical protein